MCTHPYAGVCIHMVICWSAIQLIQSNYNLLQIKTEKTEYKKHLMNIQS